MINKSNVFSIPIGLSCCHQTGKASPPPTCLAAARVENLSVTPENEVHIVREIGIPPLVSLLRSPHVRIQDHVLVTLQNICHFNPDNKPKMLRDGVMQALISLCSSGVTTGLTCWLGGRVAALCICLASRSSRSFQGTLRSKAGAEYARATFVGLVHSERDFERACRLYI